MQEIEKPTRSEVSKLDLYKTNATGFHKGNQVGNEDGHHVLDECERTNEVLCDLAAARGQDRERKSKVKVEQSADQRGQTKCRSTRLAKRVDLVLRKEKLKMRNEK